MSQGDKKGERLFPPLTTTSRHPVFSDVYTAERDSILSPATLWHPILYIFR
jgi:hypothetical protein